MKSLEEFLENAPVDFDPLRDPEWQPTREDYKSLADLIILIAPFVPREQLDKIRQDYLKMI